LIFNRIPSHKTRFGALSASKMQIFPGFRHGPRWGVYSAPPDNLAGGEGARCPLPKNPSTAYVLSASL